MYKIWRHKREAHLWETSFPFKNIYWTYLWWQMLSWVLKVQKLKTLLTKTRLFNETGRDMGRFCGEWQSDAKPKMKRLHRTLEWMVYLLHFMFTFYFSDLGRWWLWKIKLGKKSDLHFKICFHEESII